MKMKLGNLCMKRLKITFYTQRQGHTVSVKLHEEDSFLYAAFLCLISKQLTEGWILSSSTHS